MADHRGAIKWGRALDRLRVFVALGLWATSLLGATGCSLVLDPNELVADRREGDDSGTDDSASDLVEDSAGDAADGTAPSDVDATEGDGQAVDVVSDAHLEDGFDAASDAADSSDSVADSVEDGSPDISEIEDSIYVADVPADTSEDADTQLPDGDATPTEVDSSGPQLVLRHSGEDGCTLDFYRQNLTNCPKTCAWNLVFDASESVGITTFHWRMSVSGGYTITPDVASGPIVNVVISTPACLLFPLSNVMPATVTAELAIDGGTYNAVATVDFSVRTVNECAPTTLCPHP